MKSLVQYIHEAENLRPVVIYGGKFQPFHSGHYEIYEKLVNEFGKDNVFISTSDINKSKLNQKAYSENHIFTFDEKVKIMENIKVFIASICVEILKNMKTYVATDIQDGANDAKKILNDAIKELNSTGELSSSEKLSNALKRIEKLGIDNLFPSEGILFVYKDRMYKITGMFADYIALSDIIRTKKKNNEYN